MTRLLQQFSIIASLVLFVLLVNYPIIHFDMLYPEQPLIYIANQKIHHFSDLLYVYLHPQLMHYAIPFFRPSGHFLMYQLLTPFIGWQQTRMFLAVNFIFLGMTGYYMTRLYSQLFKGYWVGGFIAFAIYLSHPSLALVKLSVLHFEFAHVFFVLFGLCYFVQFCQQNDSMKSTPSLQNMGLFMKAMLAYIIAVTFKESAVMLGGVYMVYFSLCRYHRQPLSNYLRQMVVDRQAIQLLFLIAIVTISLGIYLMLPWSLSSNPVHEVMSLERVLASLKSFMIYIFSWTFLAKEQFLGNAYQDFASIWRMIEFPFYITAIMSISAILAVSTATFLINSNRQLEFKKSFIFLSLAALLFLAIPLGWGVGAPWHYHLTLIMLALIFGFSVEYTAELFISDKTVINKYGMLAALCIGLTAIITNISIVRDYQSHPVLDKPLTLGRNGLVHAPLLSGSLNSDSLIIVEDSTFKLPYYLGAGFYPLQLYYLSNKNLYMQIMMEPTRFFLPLDTNYNGSLFKWAYQTPNLKEELVPFSIDQLSQVTPPLIYQWVLNYKNIHYVAHDERGNWHDMTSKFKSNLLAEQKRRHLIVRHYSPDKRRIAHLVLLKELMLPGGDPIACQYVCDKTKGCHSYSYLPVNIVAKCKLFR